MFPRTCVSEDCHGVEPLPVTPFVVIPRNKLYKVFIQRNSGLGVKYARPVNEINIQQST